MSRKSERLVNLTIALLATKRFLTKEEIFRTIEGYEGSAESMERMFERDKDELRDLGVVIDVGTFDPLFGDELGYRIKPEEYSLDLGTLTASDIALLSLAAKAWQGAALDPSAQRALRKLQGIEIESEIASLPTLAPQVISSPDFLSELLLALTERKMISFVYRDATLTEVKRTIETYSVFSRNGFWYIVGRDRDKNEIRNFRTDRVVAGIQESGKKDAYSIPEDFDASKYYENFGAVDTAFLNVRIGKGQSLRAMGEVIASSDDWDTLEIKYFDLHQLKETVLWHLEDVIVIEPITLRTEVISSLKEIAASHG